MPEELRTPEAPVGLSYLLLLFNELASARNAGFSTPQAIGWAEMQAWAVLTEMPLSSFEARVLRLLDAAWLRAWSEGQPKAEK